jgi:hypothetical protein
VPAVAPGSLGRDSVAGLQHRDAGAALGQGQRRRQPREAAADHSHVDLRGRSCALRRKAGALSVQ